MGIIFWILVMSLCAFLAGYSCAMFFVTRKIGKLIKRSDIREKENITDEDMAYFRGRLSVINEMLD